MTTTIAAGAVGDPTTTVSVFAGFVLLTLFVVYRVSNRNTTASDYYVAGGNLTGAQNGIALAGDWLSAASFLGVAGAIAVHGYDGFLYSVGFLVAWLIELMLIAELVRNTGRFTMGDVIGYRMRQRPVRAAAANTTLVISFFYMVAQMASAGGLVALLLDVQSKFGQAMVVVAVGLIMIFYVLVGGMKGTTWVQIIKATLLLICVSLMAVFLIGRFSYDLSGLLEQAAANSPLGQALLEPGAQYGQTSLSRIDFISLAMAIVLGISCLPHIMMRFYTVPSAREARRSVVWITWTMIVFYLATMLLGFGATALVGSDAITNAPGGENSAALLLAHRIGGSWLLGVVAAIAFATILAVVAGLTLTASASFAHDVYANIIKRGKADTGSEIRVARLTALVVGVLSTVGGIAAIGQNAAFMVSLALALAASANLPTMLYSLFWRRFNTTGTLWSMYTGLVSCIVLIAFSPAVSGRPSAMFPSADFDLFPLTNPGIVSIPLGFLAGFLGTLLGKKDQDPVKQAEMEVRSLTGIGSGLKEPQRA
ncbi:MULTISPECIES: cation acetate symporter [Saccharopolyspora]|uniref:Cation acetate symporter n=1 Tax=Saccharopolyspora gregorii TaxID=33914 RepID=A0ABP6RW57_9PSEU|nr:MULTISPECIES: cation acetate symporter [Saccharopolyspora]MCA1192587.1 cation acetate symporter [Saccharopolyspora sp. 6V]MCA1226632.1 cation acetate symporter [Saccharopolyspora sp. 6M]